MTIKHIIEGRKKDLGGFSVRRILPHAKQRMVGPWIFFDHMGPAEFNAGEGINVVCVMCCVSHHAHVQNA